MRGLLALFNADLGNVEGGARKGDFVPVLFPVDPVFALEPDLLTVGGVKIGLIGVLSSASSSTTFFFLLLLVAVSSTGSSRLRFFSAVEVPFTALFLGNGEGSGAGVSVLRFGGIELINKTN
jgi:hypothetical protein